MEVDNEEGGTICLFHLVEGMPYECMRLCITCVALKLYNGFEPGKHQTNQNEKGYILST